MYYDLEPRCYEELEARVEEAVRDALYGKFRARTESSDNIGLLKYSLVNITCAKRIFGDFCCMLQPPCDVLTIAQYRFLCACKEFHQF